MNTENQQQHASTPNQEGMAQKKMLRAKEANAMGTVFAIAGTASCIAAMATDNIMGFYASMPMLLATGILYRRAHRFEGEAIRHLQGAF